jgi:cytoskeletal protein CcmA (bactofilin family)
LDTDKPDIQIAENANGTDSPRIDLSHAARSAGVRPPLRPFGAKRAKTHPFFRQPQTKGKPMSDRFNTDRMAAFTPQIPKRVADIPNLAAVRGADSDIDGKRLVIGKQIRMNGEISGCERLVVEGKVEANLSEVKSIEITANGTFKGNAEVDSAVIAGTYEGSLKVHGHLEIAPSGIVKGGVSYKTIAVANGGRLQGSIETIDS